MYVVEYVPSEELGGHKWALVKVGDDDVILLVDQAHVTPEVLEEAWAGYRLLSGQIPRQRVPA